MENIKVSYKDFVDGLSLVNLATPRDDVRFYLNNVSIEIEDNMMFLCGTDGHRLHVVGIECEAVARNKPLLIPKTDVVNFLKTFKKMMKVCDDSFFTISLKKDYDSVVHFEYNGETVSINEKALGTYNYPTWRMIAPLDGDTAMSVDLLKVNLKYVTDVHTALKPYYGKYPHVLVTPTTTSAIRFGLTKYVNHNYTKHVILVISQCKI